MQLWIDVVSINFYANCNNKLTEMPSGYRAFSDRVLFTVGQEDREKGNSDRQNKYAIIQLVKYSRK